MRSGTWLGICSWETGEGRRSEFLQCFQHSGNNKFRKELLAGEILGNKRKSNNGGTFLKECSLSHYCVIFKKSKMCGKKKKKSSQKRGLTIDPVLRAVARLSRLYASWKCSSTLCRKDPCCRNSGADQSSSRADWKMTP